MRALPPKRIDDNTVGKFSANHPDTSIAAAFGIKTGTGRRKVYDLLVRFPRGLTDEQIVNMTGLNPNSERPRRGDLVDMGLVVDSGEKRLTKSKAEAIRWKLADG